MSLQRKLQRQKLQKETHKTNLAYEEKLKTLEKEKTERRKKAEEDYYNKTKEINDKEKHLPRFGRDFNKKI